MLWSGPFFGIDNRNVHTLTLYYGYTLREVSTVQQSLDAVETSLEEELRRRQRRNGEVLDYLRETAFEVIPVSMVCGWAGISEGAFRARQRNYRRSRSLFLQPIFVHFSLRAVQVVKLQDVIDEFFPDGLSEEGEEELAIGRNNDSFFFTERGNCFRILHVGMVEPERIRLQMMKDAYKHGKGRQQEQ